MTMKRMILAAALLMAFSALPIAAQVSQVDPFYSTRLEEGKALFLSGDYAASVESLQVASFGFLDVPLKLLECHVYLLLGHHALMNEERAAFHRSEIIRLNLADKVPSLSLPSGVKARYDQINAALARMEARKTGNLVPEKNVEVPSPPTVPETKSDESAAQLAARARAEIRLPQKILLYNQALKADPRDITIYFELNDVYVTAKKYRKAADLMETLAIFYPDDIRIFIKLAENHLLNKAYEKAYRALIEAVKLDGENVEVR